MPKMKGGHYGATNRDVGRLMGKGVTKGMSTKGMGNGSAMPAKSGPVMHNPGPKMGRKGKMRMGY
jgi:hypothetical protein